MTTAHTATPALQLPLSVNVEKSDTGSPALRVRDKTGYLVWRGYNNARNREIGEFIVHACNAHDDLVKALQHCVDALVADNDLSWYVAEARKALAKAGAA